MSRKRSRFEAALVEREADEEDESSDEASDGDDAAEEDEATGHAGQATTAQQQKHLQISLKQDKGLVCHVCGKSGHKAGFVGSVYVDCPNKPCYLCKQPGHTTATCPHNLEVGGSSAGGGGIGSSAAGGGAGSSACASLVHRLLQREHSGRQARGPLVALKSPTWQVDAAILKLHSRRVCCLAVPPSSDCHVLSGDKKGGVAVWNFMQVHDRTLYTNIHRALVNTLRPAPWLTGGYDTVSASSDGTVKVFDVETGSHHTLVNANPGGWTPGCKWDMFYGMDTCQELHVVFGGDSEGRVLLLDPRTQEPVNTLQLHKPGSKVTSVSMNPAGGARVVLTAGNDHTAKLFDVRKLSSINTAAAAAASQPQPPRTPPAPAPSSAAAVAAAVAAAGDGDDAATAGSRGARSRGRGKGRGTTAAAAAAAAETPGDGSATGRGRGRGRGRGGGSRASSSTGGSPAAAAGSSGGRGKNSAAALAAAAAATAELAVLKHGRVVNAAVFSPSGRKILTTCQDNRLRVWDNLLVAGGPPSREIVHSHDFNRYLTPFKAEWFPTDPSESLVLCGRYISEDFGGVALHPVDIIDASSGRLLAALVDGHLETITPVNLPHPRLDIILSGSSRSLYKWVPQPDDDEGDELDTAAATHLSRRASAAMAAAAAAAAAAAGGSRHAGVSDSFVCFDADPQGGGSKGAARKGSSQSKAKGKTAAAAGAAVGGGRGSTKRGRRRRGGDSGDDDDDAAADSDD